jgi:MoaA/NifB/PqqE/SkfB family radical SAM enzyme
MTIANSNGQASNHTSQKKPRLIFWELTKGCNLRCIHCRASATELSSPSDLSTETAKAIIDQIAAVSSPILVLSGGEPLFRSDIFELARQELDSFRLENGPLSKDQDEMLDAVMSRMTRRIAGSLARELK